MGSDRRYIAVFEVEVAYLYKEEGRTYERSLDVPFIADSDELAIYYGIKWGFERGKSLDWGTPVCIKVGRYYVAHPEESGFIETKHGMPFFEWKYDTSGYTFEQLMERYQPKAGRGTVNTREEKN